MTFKEKLEKEHPGWTKTQCEQVVKENCPYEHGYEAETCREVSSADCESCWNREVPEDSPKPQPAAHYNPVSHPAHYTAGGIECIAAIEAALACQKDPVSAFLTGQVIKYLWRWPLKGGVEDIKKALWYLSRLEEREARHHV